MEPLIKQIRGRFSGVREKTEESGSVDDRRIPPQKTQSFKEKGKTQNWFQRQLSGKMNEGNDGNNEIEHATAVAAAAFAIKSIEESAVSDKKPTGNEPNASLVRTKSKKEETEISKPEPGRISKIFSGAGSKKSTLEVEGSDGRAPISTVTAGKSPEKAILPSPSFKKTPTFADTQLNTTDSIKPERASQPRRPSSLKKSSTFPDKELNSDGIKPKSAAPKPKLSTATTPAGPSNETKRPSAAGPGISKTAADIWEEEQIARLEERFERQNAIILHWENKQKNKSSRRLEKIEGKIVQKRANAHQKFQEDMEYIKKIAEGARAEAEERHRKQVLKVKEKANIMRTTGKAPTTCFCF